MIANNLLTGGTTPTWTAAQTTPGVNALHTFTGTGATGFYLTWCQTVGDQTAAPVRGRPDRGDHDRRGPREHGRQMYGRPAVHRPGSHVRGRPDRGADDVPRARVHRGVRRLDVRRHGADGCDLASAQWNLWAYGSAAPAVDTAPRQSVAPIGSYSWNMAKKDSAGQTIGSYTGTIPGVQWEIPPSAGPALGSGSQEVTLTGRLARLAGQVPYTINVGNQLAAYTV